MKESMTKIANQPIRELSLNERRLTELVFRNKKLARVTLSKEVDMTGASVTRLIAGLMELDLFSEEAIKDGGRGQPKKMLSLNRDRFCSVGAFVYANRFRAVLVNFDGKILRKWSQDVDEISPTSVVSSLRLAADNLVNSREAKKRVFLGIGLGVPVNFGTYGSSLQAHETFRKLDGAAVQDALYEVGNFPVYLENDGTAAALGEYLFGNQKQHSLFMLHIGYGLGGGAVLNGRPFRGHNGNACLPGSLFPYGGERPTLQDLVEWINEKGINEEEALFGPNRLNADDPVLQPWLSRASTQLEDAVRIVTGMFDPPVIVLGGLLPHDYLKDIAKRLTASNVKGPSRGLSVATVIATSQGDLNGPIGAASIPFFRLFFPGSKA